MITPQARLFLVLAVAALRVFPRLVLLLAAVNTLAAHLPFFSAEAQFFDLLLELLKPLEARSAWEAHNNAACRGEREKALALYESLSKPEREKIPQVLRVWLRYRSEKYFGAGRTAPGTKRR